MTDPTQQPAPANPPPDTALQHDPAATWANIKIVRPKPGNEDLDTARGPVPELEKEGLAFLEAVGLALGKDPPYAEVDKLLEGAEGVGD